MAKSRTCAQCYDDCRKRDILCAKCWNGLAEARRKAISRAPYDRTEKGRKFLMDLLTCDIKVVNTMVADNKFKHRPEPKPEDAELEAIVKEIVS